MTDEFKVIILDDNNDDVVLLLNELKRRGLQPLWKTADNKSDFIDLLDTEEWDLILSDYDMPNFSGMDALQIVRDRDMDIPFFLISGVVGEEIAVESMKAGAQDYIYKQNLKRLVPAITRELRDANIRKLSAINLIETRKLEQQLKVEEKRILGYYEAIACGIIVMDSGGYITHCNDEAGVIIGIASEQLIGTSTKNSMGEDWHAIHEDGSLYPGSTQPGIIALETGRKVDNAVMGVFRPNKSEVFWILINATPIFDENSEVLREVMVTFINITLRKQAEEKLNLAGVVFENTLESIIVTDGQGITQSINAAFTKLTGFTEQYMIAKKYELFNSDYYNQFIAKSLQETGIWEGEIWKKRSNGEQFATWNTIVAVLDKKENVSQYVIVSSDLTDSKKKEQVINRLAYEDMITGLPNRNLFRDRLNVAVANASRNHKKLAFIFLDLDRFKKVNDSLGHDVGDKLLHAVGQRLKKHIREVDTAARIGGDEFNILLPNATHRDASIFATKILEAFMVPFQIDHNEFFITVSMGISIYPYDGESAEDLLKSADTAMYRAKQKGRNNFQMFTSKMKDKWIKRLQLETDLRRGIERGDLLLYYQPIWDIKNDCLVGMEALVRWNHPKLGKILPGEFIPLAEESGLIIPLGEWVLRTACEQNKAWQDLGFKPMLISVNISLREFLGNNIVQKVQEILTITQLDPAYLQLEITESVMQQMDVFLPALIQLEKMGVHLSMDDFGTGYSSLNYLKHLPINILKIDKSFINDIHYNGRDKAICSTIISMAYNLNLEVIAEGVETKEQYEFLRQQQCHKVQGFYISEPLSADEFTQKFMEKWVGEITYD